MTSRTLYFNGYTYTRTVKAPCPMPGRERCMIVTEYNGKPAYWTDGYIYVREAALQNPILNKQVTDWAKKVKGYTVK